MPYPSSIDSFAGFTSSHTLSADNHASQHNSEQAGIVAVETKIGTGASTPTSGTVLRGNGAGTSSWSPVILSSDVSGKLPTSNIDMVTLLGTIYPVGCIYIEITGVNPGTTFGFGTWVAYGQGQTLIGVGTSDQAFTAGVTGGESNHALTSNEMPSHSHTITDPGHTHNQQVTTNADNNSPFYPTVSSRGSTLTIGVSAPVTTSTTGITNQNTGGGATHNNLPPYIVTYFWRRTA